MFDQRLAADGLKLRKTFEDHLNTYHWDFFGTLTFNRDISIDNATKFIRIWEGKVNRLILGRRWNKKPKDQWCLFYAFFEHPKSNLHVHFVMKINGPIGVNETAELIWENLVPGGEALIEEIGPTKADQENVTSYTVKKAYEAQSLETYIVSGE